MTRILNSLTLPTMDGLVVNSLKLLTPKTPPLDGSWPPEMLGLLMLLNEQPMSLVLRGIVIQRTL